MNEKPSYCALCSARISAMSASNRASMRAASESIFASSLSWRAVSVSKRLSIFASSLSMRAVLAAIAVSSLAVFAKKKPASAITAPSIQRIIRFSAPRTSARVAVDSARVSRTDSRSSTGTWRTVRRGAGEWAKGAVGATAVLAMITRKCSNAASRQDILRCPVMQIKTRKGGQ